MNRWPGIFRTLPLGVIKPYSSILRTLCNACICRNLTYSKTWNIQNPSIIASQCTVLKINNLLVPVSWSLRHRSGGRATYHDGHKIAFSLGPKWIRTVECTILAIKKTSVKTLQIGLYSVILNVPIKNVREKDNCNIEKTKIMIFYVNFISWDYCLFWLIPCIFYFLFVNTHHNHERIKVKH